MKSLVQTVGLLLVLAAVVSVITFMLHYTNNPVTPPVGTGKTAETTAAAVPQLTWPAKVMGWPPGEGDEFEINMEGSFPFWFWNAEKEDVGLSLQNRSCRVCSRVEMCFLAPDEARNFLVWYATSHLLNGAVQQPFQAPYPFLAGMMAVEHATVARFAKASYPWQELKESGDPVSVPPGAVGMVRLVWKGDKESPQRLGADFWTQSAARAGGPRAPTRLEVVLSFVPPVRIFPPVATLADLNPRETAEAEFLCWSATREHFTLEQKPDTLHPCFETTIRPATPEDRRKWAELKSQIRSGYVVTVKVHERRSDKQQLDLGPIRRKIELVASPDLGTLVAGVTGQVRGEVRLEGSPEKDRLALQGFSAKKEATRTFVLVSEQPGVELDSAVVIEPPKMGFLSVTLVKHKESRGGSTLWDLTVKVPPNKVSGPLPRDTAVILRILGDSPRRIRIPVSGIATN